MDYSLPFVTWFWLLVPNGMIVLLSLCRLIREKRGDK